MSTTILPSVSYREALLARAVRVIPGGASAGGRPVYGDVITRAHGAYLWNADGKRYIDHLNAYGPIVIGHSDVRVNGAVADTVARVDLNWVGPQAGEVELAERIVGAVPSADKVVFMNTGTDALQHALHVARAATGRQRVFKFHGHYHGWAGALGVGASFDVAPGVAPPTHASNSGGSEAGIAASVDVVDWNDAAATSAAFAVHGDSYAAAFVEPYLHSYTNAAPAPGFLELLRELCDRHGVVLVFDEVKTGFRHHLGGYQAIAAVTPDLTALGKAMGNGYAIAALAGRAGIGSGWIINWRAEPPVTFRQAVHADFDRAEAFRLAMLDDGILLPPYVITDARINLAFTEDDVDETVAAAGSALRRVR